MLSAENANRGCRKDLDRGSRRHAVCREPEPAPDAWRRLDQAAARLRGVSIEGLFGADEARLQRLTVSDDGILLDLSKQDVDAEAFDALIALARGAKLEDQRDAMASGAPVNDTEGRAALHMALRGGALLGDAPMHRDVANAVRRTREKSRIFTEAVRDGQLRGATGKPFENVVNIGIGGSDLGPALVVDALTAIADGPSPHFVSNLDGAALSTALSGLSPETTLFVVCSKTFSTLETLTNANTAKKWLTDALGDAAVGAHFAASTSNAEGAVAFGIDEARIFEFWDWVGGRFSLWSSVGLSSEVAVGSDAFDALLDGARAMDRHFLEAPLERNLPVLLALSDIWQRTVLGRGSRAVAVYDERLKLLPAFLQQLEMESNGKGVDRNGDAVAERSAGVIWGGVGCDAQHAFFQMLHQGPETIPVEFVAVREGAEPALTEHHKLLLANCFAQSRALMTGLSKAEALASLLEKGLSEDEATALAPHLACPGDRPSTTIVLDHLGPRSLGQLLAMAEHRTFSFGAILGLNPFDQFGVELGKTIAKTVAAQFDGRFSADLDPSTRMLVRFATGAGLPAGQRKAE